MEARSSIFLCEKKKKKTKQKTKNKKEEVSVENNLRSCSCRSLFSHVLDFCPVLFQRVKVLAIETENLKIQKTTKKEV